MVVKFRQVFYSIATNGSRIYTFRLLWMDYEIINLINIKMKTKIRTEVLNLTLDAWKKIKEFDFPHKRAALVECSRERFFQGEYL